MGLSDRTNVELTPLPESEMDWQLNTPYDFNGLGIVVEYKAGDTRTKVKSNGTRVTNVMPTAYGYLLGTTDVHGECIDVYVVNNRTDGVLIYVIDQVEPATGQFDEHKIMLGFDSETHVEEIYTAVFADGSGSKRLGAITTFSEEEFSAWLEGEGYSLSPACKYATKTTKITMKAGIKSPPPNPNFMAKPVDEAGGVIITLPDLSKGPKLITKAAADGDGLSYTLNLFGPLDSGTWSNAIDTFCRALYFATDKDEVHINIASPGGSVFLMGRMLSAIHATKAKVYTHARGQIASAATTVFVAGHVRTAYPGSYFMQHMSSQFMWEKTTAIVRKAQFCREYIERILEPAIACGLYTAQEVKDMIEKDADIYVSGRDAMKRLTAAGDPVVSEAEAKGDASDD